MSEYPTYLIHYGIQGQKWGERRFQNEDGTYTPEGLERRRKFFNVEKGKMIIDKYGKGTGDYRIARKNVLRSRITKGVGVSAAGMALYAAAGISMVALNTPAAVAAISVGAGYLAAMGGMAYDVVQQVKAVGDVASVNMYDKVKRRKNPKYNEHNDIKYG